MPAYATAAMHSSRQHSSWT